MPLNNLINLAEFAAVLRPCEQAMATISLPNHDRLLFTFVVDALHQTGASLKAKKPPYADALSVHAALIFGDGKVLPSQNMVTWELLHDILQRNSIGSMQFPPSFLRVIARVFPSTAAVSPDCARLLVAVASISDYLFGPLSHLGRPLMITVLDFVSAAVSVSSLAVDALLADNDETVEWHVAILRLTAASMRFSSMIAQTSTSRKVFLHFTLPNSMQCAVT